MEQVAESLVRDFVVLLPYSSSGGSNAKLMESLRGTQGRLSLRSATIGMDVSSEAKGDCLGWNSERIN